MPDSPFELSVDSDWKQQAREEKKRLAAEAEQRRQASAPPPSTPSVQGGNLAPSTPAPAARDDRGPADFAALVDALARQATLYLGGVALRDGQGIVDLDTAKHHIDLLAVLETKVADTLDPAERSALDVALYETRSRFAAVASRYIL